MRKETEEKLKNEIEILLGEYKETGDDERIVNVIEFVMKNFTEKEEECKKAHCRCVCHQEYVNDCHYLNNNKCYSCGHIEDKKCNNEHCKPKEEVGEIAQNTVMRGGKLNKVEEKSPVCSHDRDCNCPHDNNCPCSKCTTPTNKIEEIDIDKTFKQTVDDKWVKLILITARGLAGKINEIIKELNNRV